MNVRTIWLVNKAKGLLGDTFPKFRFVTLFIFLVSFHGKHDFVCDTMFLRAQDMAVPKLGGRFSPFMKCLLERSTAVMFLPLVVGEIIVASQVKIRWIQATPTFHLFEHSHKVHFTLFMFIIPIGCTEIVICPFHWTPMFHVILPCGFPGVPVIQKDFFVLGNRLCGHQVKR